MVSVIRLFCLGDGLGAEERPWMRSEVELSSERHHMLTQRSAHLRGSLGQIRELLSEQGEWSLRLDVAGQGGWG